MLDFDRLRSRFAQFGGWRLVWQYARMGVLWTSVMALVRCALKGVSMKAAYPVITRKVDERLILRYRHILDDNKRRLLKERSEGDISSTCSWAWLFMSFLRLRQRCRVRTASIALCLAMPWRVLSVRSNGRI